MRARGGHPWAIGLVVVASVACGRTAQDAGSEQRFVEREIAELEAALAARSESKVTVGCSGLSAVTAQMPPAIARKIARLCYVEAPRLYLENGMADVTEHLRTLPGGGSPDQRAIICMELMVDDAFKTLAQHPPTDPALQKLVDAYTRLCPERAAKLRGK